MTPTELTLKHLRAGGIPCEKVEHRQSHSRYLQDLFGIIDVIALDHKRGVIGIQATTKDHFPERYIKLTQTKAEKSLTWLLTPGTILEIWGWDDEEKLNVKEIDVGDIKIDQTLLPRA